MTNYFHEQIKTALANSSLQIALDNNAVRRREARLIAINSLPEDLQAMRSRAHNVRADVIANLDDYLAKFILRATDNGMIVHQASDAAEASQIVLDIAAKHDAHLLAKAKSMLSEEIHLNPALETAGLQVVETDLGEYIVQLRGERPAHIITPAVHLRRSDVGVTFHEKLGLPLTDDVPTLTSAARKKLRQVFFEADIGLSGVNFGVAETGTICLVTNEGNGRMVVTLPPVHIALMGIERLVPTVDDLALMLYLLPRYATGQKLSVYVSLLNGPSTNAASAGASLDGPAERHIILIDNGRRAISKSHLAEALYCIRCGSCLNACPVFREIGGHAYVSIHGEGSIYPGPIGSVLSPALYGQSEYGHLARASSLCGACKDACPVEIDLPKLLLRVRAGLNEAGIEKHSPQAVRPNAPAYLMWGMRFYTWFAVSPRRFALAQRLAGLFGRLIAPTTSWMRLPALTGWGYSKDFPRPAARSFRERWAAHQAQVRTAAQNEDGENNSAAEAGNRPQVEPANRQSLVEQFCVELAALGGSSIRCQSSELAHYILDFLGKRSVSRIQTWQESGLPGGLLEVLQAAGVEIVYQHNPSISVGLTGVDGAIAESGTLVITGAPQRPLSASLVPEVHLAILNASAIHARLSDAIQMPEIRQASAAALISGPSRTADIEMTLTVGMHGPGEVLVFCLTDR